MSIYSAQQLASMGRGNDSMLVHMTPREVGGLQALAMAQGGSLSINPSTGLPEAGFLDRLLPTLIGAGLSFMGAGPLMAAGIVGGAETIRSGDLGKGLMAGLGAFGGAGLGSSLAGAGSLGASAADVAAQQGNALAQSQAMNILGPETTGGFDLSAIQNAGSTGATNFASQPVLDQVKGSFAAMQQPEGLSNFGQNLMGQYGGKYGAMAAAYPAVSELMRPPDIKLPQEEKKEDKPPVLPMPRIYNPRQADPRKISSEYNYFDPSNPYPGFIRG